MGVDRRPHTGFAAQMELCHFPAKGEGNGVSGFLQLHFSLRAKPRGLGSVDGPGLRAAVDQGSLSGEGTVLLVHFLRLLVVGWSQHLPLEWTAPFPKEPERWWRISGPAPWSCPLLLSQGPSGGHLSCPMWSTVRLLCIPALVTHLAWPHTSSVPRGELECDAILFLPYPPRGTCDGHIPEIGYSFLTHVSIIFTGVGKEEVKFKRPSSLELRIALVPSLFNPS